jgi:hypothetical protein
MAVLNRICHESHRPVREVNNEIPEQLASIIDRLLDKKPSRRPSSAAEVQQTLAGLLSDVQQGRLRRPNVWHRLSRTQRIVASVVVVTVLIGAGVWMCTWLDRPEVAPPAIRTGPSPPVHRGEEYSGDAVTKFSPSGPRPRQSTPRRPPPSKLNSIGWNRKCPLVIRICSNRRLPGAANSMLPNADYFSWRTSLIRTSFH